MDKRKASESIKALYVTRTKYIHKKMTFFATKRKRRKHENYIECLGLAIEALNKQIPNMVEVWNGQASCPRCKKLYGNMEDIKKLGRIDFKYCKYCGQRIKFPF